MERALKVLVFILFTIVYFESCYIIFREHKEVTIIEEVAALEQEPIIIDEPKVIPAPKDKPMPIVLIETSEEKLEKEIIQLNVIKDDKEEYLILYKQIWDKYPDVSPRPITIYDVFTEDEITLVCRCIQSEVENCPFFAKVHVAEVVLNRLYSDAYPNEISKVVVPGQFSLRRDYYSEESLLAFEYAYLFETEEMFDCFNFQSAGESETFCGRTLKYYDGYHWFY